jgi:1,4-alpha-glucan branching enzyme
MLPDQITFYYFDPGGRATQVALISSFNQWNPRGYDFRMKSSGLWQLTIPTLPTGQYRYKYLVDGVWLNDPENPERIEDGHGGFTSILVVVK